MILPDDRFPSVRMVRNVILKNLDLIVLAHGPNREPGPNLESARSLARALAELEYFCSERPRGWAAGFSVHLHRVHQVAWALRREAGLPSFKEMAQPGDRKILWPPRRWTADVTPIMIHGDNYQSFGTARCAIGAIVAAEGNRPRIKLQL